MAGEITLSKLSKHQKHNVGDMQDMISDLPEGILLYILSFLPTKDAVRTTILAKTWKYLWTHLSVFNFEVCCYQHGSKPKKKPENCLIDQVDKLLQRSNSVERLCIKVRGTMDAQNATSLLSSKLLHKVVDLKLYIEDINAMFVLPNSFSASQSLNNLHLEFGFNLNIGDDICFPSLKTLYLSRICFANEKSAQRLFSRCPVLQELTLYRCSWLNVNQINVAMSTLRKLTIEGLGYSPNNCTIKFDVANLLSLSYTINPAINFFLVNPTSIVDASIHLGHLYNQNQQLDIQSVIELLSRLSSVKTLSLSNYVLQCLNYAKDTLHLLPSFDNLMHLDVFLGYFCPTSEALASILCKTPKLEVLYIHKGSSLFFDEGWTSNSLPCCFESSLKVCFISNFRGDEDEIQSVKFLLENATVLEYINIFCSKYLSANLEMLADVRNQLQHLGLGRRCIINLQ